MNKGKNMVFSSIAAYAGDPVNWQQTPPQLQQQQQNHQFGSTSSNPPPHNPPSIPAPHFPSPPVAQVLPHVGGAATTCSIRPGSMANRARMANIPMPEAALKCPRCESTNTKFCYFNNYSLSQPRHFCKACRRYWTRGGSLRTVPVGGGCRRNKRSKGGSSKSTATSSDHSTTSSSATSTPSMNTTSMADILGLSAQVPLRLIAPLSGSSLHDYGGGEIGLNYSGIRNPVSEMSYQLGSSSFSLGGGGGGGGVIGGGASNFLLPATPSQFPFFAGLDAATNLYPFEGSDEMSGFGGGAATATVTPVKIEGNQGLNLSRQFMGIQGSDQYWGGGVGGGSSASAWTDLSGLNSSSSTL
ncbi:hypothetical protein Nepgr_031948 [Nepenthes gracilis]|uniref:Dof zinc finger protein n=1 Tax=Nepenthes gracilis TaxID=150966 RepID=A0AAD3Y7A5_NEPGR|nr:hypothetical protein Nepgr_031948 [Nepenthes gracilis]